MANERTLSIIKPDAVAKNVIGEIYSRFEKAGLNIVASRMMHLTQEQAEGFYCRAQRASVLQRSGCIYDIRSSGCSGSGRRRRHPEKP